MASKVLLIGSVNGEFTTVFKKVAKLQEKQDFSFVLIAGDLFRDPSAATEEDRAAEEALVKGDIDVALPTYFTCSHRALPSVIAERLQSHDDEVCQNLSFLRKRSLTRTLDGINIATLAGQFARENAKAGDAYQPFYTLKDAKALSSTAEVDILLTSEWPKNVLQGSKVAQEKKVEETKSEECIADLCTSLKPRYHFSTSSGFFEREPFVHEGDEKELSPGFTRFISLASFNTPKEKWLYAFSLTSKAHELAPVPAGSTPSPFLTGRKRPNSERTGGFDSLERRHAPHRKRRREKQPPPGPAECFFCLSNSNFSTHMLASIGDDAYVATARGPLTVADDFPGLNCPAHVLIVPLSHLPALSHIPDPSMHQATFKEMDRYRKALYSMLDVKSSGNLGAVAWEINRNRGVHFHWQLVPVKKDLIEKGLVEAAFTVEAQNEDWPEFEERDIGDASGEGDYFRVWLWYPNGEPKDSASADDAGVEKSLVLPLNQDIRFDLQFGRRVLAKLLKIERRLDWRECCQEEDEETQEAEKFKEAFKKFDFTINTSGEL